MRGPIGVSDLLPEPLAVLESDGLVGDHAVGDHDLVGYVSTVTCLVNSAAYTSSTPSAIPLAVLPRARVPQFTLALLVCASLAGCTCLSPVSECTPRTCAEQGKDCGVITDGCGQVVECGTCSAREFCGGGGPNVCGVHPCEPTTCTALDAECGLVGDGCAGALDCGSCPDSMVCGVVGAPNQCVPACVPATCETRKAECGDVPDGCGRLIFCGTCAGGQPCDDGRCVCAGPACAPPPVLTAARLTPDRTRLSWTIAPPAPAEVQVQRRADGGTFGTIAAVPGTAPDYDDGAQVRGLPYWYRVRALTEPGAGPWSNVVSVAGVPVPPPSSNVWRTMGGDVAHTGFNNSEMGGRPTAVAWTSTATSAFGPAVTDGARVYFGGLNRLVAVDVADGGTVWTQQYSACRHSGYPAVFDGTVYVACNRTSPNGTFSAFNATDGAPLFSVWLEAQWEQMWSPIKLGSTVFTAGGYYGGLYGYDARSGATVFFNSGIGQSDQWSPATDGTHVYTFVRGFLQALDPTTGVQQWMLDVNWQTPTHSMETSPVVWNRLAFAIAPPVLYAIDLDTHAVRWSITGLDYSQTPAVAGGVLYAVNSGNIRAHDAESGRYLWSFAGDGALSYPPVLTGTHLFAASDANVYAVDLATRTQVWTAPGGGWLSVAAGKLFVTTSAGMRAWTLAP